MGPSRYLMPDLFENFFKDFGKDISDYLTLTKLDPSYKIYFKDNPDHPVVDVSSDLEKNRELFESIEPGSMKQLDIYLKKSKYTYEIGMNEFATKNYDSVLDFFKRDMMLKGLKMNIFVPISTYVKRYFRSDEMQKILQYPMVFLWSPTDKTPALYNLMTYVDFGMWVRYPQWGMGSLVQGLISLGKELWVTYHTDSEVTKIATEPIDKKHFWQKKKSKIVGLELHTGEIVTSDIVISNADMHWTETQLLDIVDQTYNESYWKKHVLAPSGFCLYLWLDKKVAGIDHHTLIFNKDRDQSNRDIFEHKKFPQDPSYYICCPSKTDDSVAPEGMENLFILVPFPSRVTMDEAQKLTYRNKIIAHTEDILWQQLEWHIIHEEIFWPDEFTKRYHAYGWNALNGWAHLFKQTAIFRPNNVSKKVEGLHYAGWYTNPGIWVPTCLISGKLVSERISSM